MNRQEAYERCARTLEQHEGHSISEVLLPKEAVDAIIDCAVQEAVKEMWRQLDEMAERVEREVRGE